MFSSVHKECEEKHSAGVGELRRLLANYFNRCTTISDVQQLVPQLRRDNYITADDIALEAGAAIDSHTGVIHRPFSAQVVAEIVQLIAALGEPYSVLDRNGAVTRFAQKIIKGYIADFFTGRIDIYAAQSATGQVSLSLPLSKEALQETYLYMLNKAATNFLKDGLLSSQEEQLVDTYTKAFGIATNNLPATYQNSDIVRLTQSTILAGLQRGVVPQQNKNVPIMLGREEVVLWQYGEVKLYEEKVQREYHGNRGGFSIRVCKGVYYRPSTSRVKPVEHSYMNLEGTGTLYVTNKHLVFNSNAKGVKIPYNKIIGVTPYADGLEVNRDGNAKRIIFQGFDSWFVVNAMSLITNL